MKKLLCFLGAASILFALVGCGSKKILHCDNCNKEVAVNADSNMEEDWSIFCEECNKALFGE